MKNVFWLNLFGSLGFSIFQNFGFIGALIVFTSKWYMGEMLQIGDSFTLLAIIYYMFFTVNSLTIYSINAYCQSLAIIYRLSEVLRMKEHQSARQSSLKKD